MTPTKITIAISKATGAVTYIFSDEAAALCGHLDDRKITRASHVEPNDDGSWSADLLPVHGPILGPFPRRDEALAAEVEWLRVHYLGAPIVNAD